MKMQEMSDMVFVSNAGIVSDFWIEELKPIF